MFKRFSFWLWALVTFQLLTAVLHGISLFIEPIPENDTEKQMMSLVQGHHMPDGMGFSPTYASLFLAVSSCFTLLCIFGACINIYLWRKKTALPVMKGIMGIHVIIFGVCFAMMALFTFLPPILCTGLIFISSLAAFFTAKERW